MSPSNRVAVVKPAPADPTGQHQTSGLTVVGWLLLSFAVIPLTMGLGDRDAILLSVGGAMAAIGVVLVVIGRMLGRASTRSTDG